jgi:hypothetical protein
MFITVMKKLPSVPVFRAIAVVFAVFAIAGGLASCGMEEYSYMPSPTESGGAVTEVQLNNKATIRLPNSVSNSNFTHFAILYRLYVSGENISGQIQNSATELNKINPYLLSDYNALAPYADVTNTSSIDPRTVFLYRYYYTLYLEGVNIDNVLTFGREVVIEFPAVTGAIPTLSAGGNTYNLWRSRGNNDGLGTPANTPLPGGNRYFLNYSELNAKQDNGTSIPENLDVAGNSVSGPRYTYISLYWVDIGLITATMAPQYSKPTFIGILKLPEAY